MIPLTRLNHQELILNCDLIKFIEHAHDTVITLVNGEKLTVEEEPEEILRRIGQFRREQAAASIGRPPAVAGAGEGSRGPG
ncbi:MAG: flagellar FlbD family protein [Terriglobales bacterium]